MRRARNWAYLPVFCMLALRMAAGQGASSNELKLGTATGKFGQDASVPLTLSTTDQVQGLVAAFDWDGTMGTGSNFVKGPTLDDPAEANVYVTRVEPSYMVVGIVMDADGVGNEVINPGTGILIGTAVIHCGADPNPDAAGDQVVTPITFKDGLYARVGDEPKLDNIVVVGGLSIGAEEGLVLTNGSFECGEGFNRFYIAPGATNTNGACGDARVLMENLAPVEGYVVSLCHDSAELTLSAIAVGAAATAQAADFSASEIFPTGGTLGVVIDLVAPFTNNTIPAGVDQEIARYNYCCKTVPTTGQTQTPLTFCDNALGNPLKENVIVVGGQSLNPRLENGTFTCKPGAPPSENCNNGVDDDGDGLIDAQDPDCAAMFACGSRTQDATGMPGPIIGSVGSTAEVCFFYKSPEDNAPGHAQFDHIQGFSMALTFCCDVKARPAIDITGTIVEAVGAEFVSVQADNDPSDGDGCELIIGVLVDALPPFDGATLPPTSTLTRVGCVLFDITDDPSLCGKCCFVNFTDGVNGVGNVPIKNLISVENVSRGPQLMNCEICIKDKEKFFRGDCNFSQMGSMSVDIADAAAVVSFLFLPGTWKFNPPCLDACDCNDDGRIDLADAVCILQFLFQQGREPPPPGPGLDAPAGPDPTADKLDCKAGNDCV
jgi:hypothetical protein